MDRKALIPYGLCVAKGFVSAHLAVGTGFSDDDLGYLWPARISVVRLDADAAQRRKEIDSLFAEFETDLSGFKFNRDELYDR